MKNSRISPLVNQKDNEQNRATLHAQTQLIKFKEQENEDLKESHTQKVTDLECELKEREKRINELEQKLNNNAHIIEQQRRHMDKLDKKQRESERQSQNTKAKYSELEKLHQEETQTLYNANKQLIETGRTIDELVHAQINKHLLDGKRKFEQDLNKYINKIADLEKELKNQEAQRTDEKKRFVLTKDVAQGLTPRPVSAKSYTQRTTSHYDVNRQRHQTAGSKSTRSNNRQSDYSSTRHRDSYETPTYTRFDEFKHGNLNIILD